MGFQAVSMLATAVLSFTAGALAISPFVRDQGGHAADDRVFELRVYHTLPGRLPQLQANFRDHNLAFLKKHGITSIGYWTPRDAPAAENTLIFVVAHESREAAARHWTELRDDPEWQAMAKSSESAGPIVEKVESTFMQATDYSPLR
jgi:hypothetical protein